MDKIRSLLAAILAAAIFIPMQASALEGALLGLSVEHPQINSSVDTALTCSYDGTTLRMQSQASNIQFMPAGPFTFIFGNNTGTVLGGLVDISVPINSSGVLQAGGTIDITGFYQDSSLNIQGPNLYSGTISDFGALDGGVTDVVDVEITTTGGAITAEPLWPASTNAAAIVELVNSGYTFTGGTSGFSVPWNCDTSKSTTGPSPVGDACNLTVTKTATPVTVGPEVLGADTDDSDSDSGRDHNNDGDTDDTDSASSANSSDSDGVGMACGCKGRVKELTIRWNALTAATVMVENNKGVVLFATTLIQPGEEFTFTVTGKKITLYADGQEVQTLKVKCKYPIGPGQMIGDFMVVSGKSKAKNMLPLCPFPGTTCGPEFEVTYDYKVTNTGPGDAIDVIVFDDQLGVIDSFASNPALALIPAGGMVTVSTTVCVFDTTTNVATAFGVSNSTGEACTFDPTGNTATVSLLPNPCLPGDSDSDSGSDNNNSGDTDDDSDSDSSVGDCDGDGT